MTLEERLSATEGRPSGFDYLRIILSVSVVSWHAIRGCYGPSAETRFWFGPFRPFLYFILPGFFSLSGFLVAGSLERLSDIPTFITLRAVRIFPALLCEVIISAIFLGPILTSLPWTVYFTDHSFWSYFGNIAGDIHFLLPGVFVSNPTTEVNLQLWTIPSELECYLLITTLSILTIDKRPNVFAACAAATNSAAYLYDFPHGLITSHAAPTGPIIVACFTWGVSLYLCRARVPFSFWLFAGSVAVAVLTLDLNTGSVYLAPAPMAYITVYLGLLNPRRILVVAAGDFSYGIYLYGFPVQQTVSYLCPTLRSWYFNLPLALPVAAILAWISWRLVEQPVLARKHCAIRLVDAFVKGVKS